MDDGIKEQLWEKAKETAPKDRLGKLHVHIAYSKLVLGYFNERGGGFANETIGDMGFVKEIALK